MYSIFKPIYLVWKFPTDLFIRNKDFDKRQESAQRWIQLRPASPDTPHVSFGDHRTNIGIFVHALVKNPPASGTYVKCNLEDLTLDSALAAWGRATGRVPNPGLTAVVQIPIEQYIALCGSMGEEQASQLIFFDVLKKLDVISLPGATLVEGSDLLSEVTRQSADLLFPPG